MELHYFTLFPKRRPLANHIFVTTTADKHLLIAPLLYFTIAN